MVETAFAAHVAGEEVVVDREGAGVDVTDGVDEADDAARRRRGSVRGVLAPKAARWKKESPVRTFSPWATSQS